MQVQIEVRVHPRVQNTIKVEAEAKVEVEVEAEFFVLSWLLNISPSDNNVVYIAGKCHQFLVLRKAMCAYFFFGHIVLTCLLSTHISLLTLLTQILQFTR